MKAVPRFASWMLVLASLLLAGCASAPSTPATEWDGLVRQPNQRLDAVFVRPGAAEAIGGFRNVKLDIVSVSFASDFDPTRGNRGSARRLNADDLVAIKDNLAEMTREIVSAELTSGGYTLVDAPGPDTLLVSAAIVDLFITAPDPQSAGRTRTFTADSGRMTIVLELRDSVTGELMARVVDQQTGRRDGTWSITNRVTNTADARRAIRNWAIALREGLDVLKARSGRG